MLHDDDDSGPATAAAVAAAAAATAAAAAAAARGPGGGGFGWLVGGLGGSEVVMVVLALVLVLVVVIMAGIPTSPRINVFELSRITVFSISCCSQCKIVRWYPREQHFLLSRHGHTSGGPTVVGFVPIKCNVAP